MNKTTFNNVKYAYQESPHSENTVEARSPAAQHNLRANDIIIAVGRTPIANVAQLRAAIKDANAFALTIRRGNARIVTVID
jgi:S1-C subfamily serine protease